MVTRLVSILVVLCVFSGCSDPPAPFTVNCGKAGQAEGQTYTVDCGDVNTGNDNVYVGGSENVVGNEDAGASAQPLLCAIPQVIPCDVTVCKTHAIICNLPNVCPVGYTVGLADVGEQTNCLRTTMSACGHEVHCCPTQICPVPIHCNSDETSWFECPSTPCVIPQCNGGYCGLGGYNSVDCGPI